MLRFITVRSKNLAGRGDMLVYVPPVNDLKDVPIVILLHGVYGSAWAWALKAGVHETAQRMIADGSIKPMVLVMPSDGLWRDGSGYIPHKQNGNYEKWITEDVVAAVRQEIKITSPQSPLFITGLSMGGYGALRIGATYPTLFKAFSGLSSITAFEQLALFYENENIDALKESVTQQPSVAEAMLQNKDALPPFMFDCGNDDVLIDYNRQLHQQLQHNNIPHQYHEHTGGHSWNYWTKAYSGAFAFF
ncbi:MAG: esterase family protein [Bacteroidia bacterium]|nr:esterase family protein [Bacteroidia bacterium]